MRGVRFSLILGLFGAVACDAPVAGELSIEAADGRVIEYAPKRCADGHSIGYFGVELRDDDDRVLEFFRNGDQPELAFYAPGEAAFELDPEDCERLTGELHRESFRRSDIGEVRGQLEADGVAPNGWRLVGSLSFEECHAPSTEEDCEDG